VTESEALENEQRGACDVCVDPNRIPQDLGNLGKRDC
jgi:hypothetical protein